MLILKGFFHKKTSKIYIILIMFIFLCLLLLKSFYNYYNNIMINETKDNFISVALDKKNLNKISDLHNIKKIEENIFLESDEDYIKNIYLKKDTQLKDNEIILHSLFSDNFKIGDTITFQNKIEKYYFTIVSFSDKIPQYQALISEKVYEKLSNFTNIREYRIYPKTWGYSNKIIKELKKIKEIIPEYGINTNVVKENNNLVAIVSIISIITNSMLLIFTIIYIILIINIFYDEKKNNYLIKCIGFRNKNIFYYNYLKILLLFLLSLLLSSIVFIILKLILVIINIEINFDYLFFIELFIIAFTISTLYNCFYILKERKKYET